MVILFQQRRYCHAAGSLTRSPLTNRCQSCRWNFLSGVLNGIPHQHCPCSRPRPMRCVFTNLVVLGDHGYAVDFAVYSAYQACGQGAGPRRCPTSSAGMNIFAWRMCAGLIRTGIAGTMPAAGGAFRLKARSALLSYRGGQVCGRA